MTATIVATTRNVPLIAARVLAGLIGAVQLAGATYFLLIAPEEAIWVGPWIDVPIVALTLTTIFLKLGLAVLPGLAPTRRIAMGLLAFVIGIGVTLVKVPVYDEPEGITFLVVDAVLLTLLGLAWRKTKR